MKKWKEKRTMGPKNIKWWKCKDEKMAEYRKRVRRKYEELDSEKGTVEGEWRQYKDAFVGVEVEEIRQEEVETAMHKMKKGKATGADEVRLEMLEMTGEVGVKWT